MRVGRGGGWGGLFFEREKLSKSKRLASPTLGHKLLQLQQKYFVVLLRECTNNAAVDIELAKTNVQIPASLNSALKLKRKRLTTLNNHNPLHGQKKEDDGDDYRFHLLPVGMIDRDFEAEVSKEGTGREGMRSEGGRGEYRAFNVLYILCPVRRASMK